jgi:hypothetical protein
VVGDIIVDSDALLVTDFMNLKFKSTQFFECAHMDRVCVRVFIEKILIYIYINIYVCNVFLKKKWPEFRLKPYLFDAGGGVVKYN